MTHGIFEYFGRSAGTAIAPGWRRTVVPQSEVEAPVTVAELSAFLEDPCPPSQGDSDFALREQFLVMATQQAIDYCDREMLQREIVVRFDAYPRAHSSRGRLAPIDAGFEFFAELPRVPMASFDRVELIDEDGATEEIPAEDYDLDELSEPARLRLSEPPLRGELAYFAGLRVYYTAGYEDTDSVPQALKLGVLMHAAYLWDRRGMGAAGSLSASGALSLYEPWRIRTGL